jgi:hypothetical protein
MVSGKSIMADISEQTEIENGAPENPQAENHTPLNPPEPAPAPQNSEPVNTVAETVAPAELIAPRGRGRPKGSKTKNRRDASGKFVPAADVLPFAPAEPAPQFISQIPGEPGGAPSPEPGQSQPENPAPAPAAVDYKATAFLMVGMGTSTLAMIFGPEWQPENEAERDQLINAVEIYLQTKQCADIPPGAMLCIVLAVYSSKRFHQPSTKGKLVKVWFWLKSKFSRRKANPVVPFPKQENNSQP